MKLRLCPNIPGRLNPMTALARVNFGRATMNLFFDSSGAGSLPFAPAGERNRRRWHCETRWVEWKRRTPTHSTKGSPRLRSTKRSRLKITNDLRGSRGCASRAWLVDLSFM
jgi:hypothetical protein